MSDLILDRNIKTWIFIPIVIMAFFLGLLKYYLSICFDYEKTINTDQLKDGHFILRLRALRLNASYIPKSAFLMRSQQFLHEINSDKANNNNTNNNQNGNDKKEKLRIANFDPSLYTNMLKSNMINLLPMLLTGSWIVYMFSDFIATKLPFSITIQFKTMLQRSISLNELNEPWVSCASWYCLCVFGLRDIYNVILGDDGDADFMNLYKTLEDNLVVSIGSTTNVDNLLEKEFEELQLVQHDWILKELCD